MSVYIVEGEKSFSLEQKSFSLEQVLLFATACGKKPPLGFPHTRNDTRNMAADAL